MIRREPHRENITSELKEALGRDDEARSIQQAAHIGEMNRIADLLAAKGPLDEVDGMAAFLFGMYGIKRMWHDGSKQPEQLAIEERASRFNLNNTERPFALSGEQGPHDQPWKIYAYSHDLFEAHMRRAPIDSDFSAVEYGIRKSYDQYIGHIAVPVVAVNFRDLRPSSQDHATIFEVSRYMTETSPRHEPSIDAEPQFGTLIAEWRRRDHTDYYVKELQRIQEATDILDAELKRPRA